ncbi:NYN domain-containing protein [Nanchangia anserum]|uniref:NYN domain-containing protein n=1 Tax=Nanchangia anserum TaxID=2692125 RepID=A0A8I0GA80_9ACTO|nr:NYN domain-containing protein [Nanchangia anserum]MBD3690014.1 NYN domain-containing protein [Nanchangia anserum]QOX82186.1 NYN domain-containing protein [Nanchangia anserum]
MASEPTYLVIDGENIDATLGMSVLSRRPDPEERPRWDRVLRFASGLFDTDTTKGLFFLNASSGHLPMGFVQALLAMDYTPIPLSSDDAEDKVVDIGIQRMLDAIRASGRGNVLLGSHDGDFVPQVEALLAAGHRVGVLAFPEFLSSSLAQLVPEGLEVCDLEHDVHAFQVSLPRLKIIPLDEFRPEAFL